MAITATEARRALTERLRAGIHDRDRLMKAVLETVIIDRLVPPTKMKFVSMDGLESIKLRYLEGTTPMDVVIHAHAFGQLCQKAGLPMTYAHALNVPPKQLRLGTNDQWRQDLLCENLNELFHQQDWGDRNGPARFLHRLVGGELRGFLSRRFNRHLASAPLLRAFVEGCANAGAEPMEALTSHVRSSMKYLYPEVFEVVPGEYVCIGSEWSNSDFGAGRLSVAQTVWRVGSSTSAVVDETLGRIHIGSVIEDSDLEISETTARKEVETQQSAINDAVREQFSERSLERMLAALKNAHEQEVPWSRLKGQLAKFLNKSDLEWLQSTLDGEASIIDLPTLAFDADGIKSPTLWWAAAAVSAIAAKTTDTDRQSDLQRAAGSLLGSVLKKEKK